MKKNCLWRGLLACLLLIAQWTFSQNGIVRVKEYGISTSNTFKHVIRTADNNYVVFLDADNTTDDRIIKYDTVFNVIWEISVGRGLKDIIQTADGGFIACGLGSSDGPVYSENVWVKKFNASGNQEWFHNYGGTGQDNGIAIRQKVNGNYVVFAFTRSTDGDVLNKTTTDLDVWVFELNNSGTIVDQTVLGGSGFDGSDGSVAVTADGGVIVATSSNSTDGHVSGNHGDYDVWVVKLDAVYNIQWQKALGGSGSDFAHSIYQDQAGDYVIAGQNNSTDGDIVGSGTFTDAYVLKLDPAGNIKWVLPVYGTYYEELFSAKPVANNDIVVTGLSASDVVGGLAASEGAVGQCAMLLRINPNGQIVWARKIGGSSLDIGWDVTESVNNGFILCGMRYYNSFGGDFTNLVPSVGETRGFIMEVRDLSTIRGVVFLDYNNNEIMEAGEEYNSAQVSSSKGTVSVNNYPNNAKFIISVDTGTYITSLKFPDTTNYGISPKRKWTSFTTSGQTDSFPIRIVPIGLIEDLQVSVTRLTDAWLDHAVKYRLKLRNAGGKTISNPRIKVIPDDHFSYYSSERPLSSTSGDTLIWDFSLFPALHSDSFEVTFFTKSLPDIHPGSGASLMAIAEPYTTDFDTLDNVFHNETVIVGQNAAITGITFSVSAPDSARINRTIPYSIYYGFTSMLDSTRGIVRLVKNANTSFVSAIPAPAAVVNDTITWNFKDISYGNTDTIVVNLKTEEGGGLQPGDHIYFTGQLRFLTADTSELIHEFLLSKQVTGYFIDPDTVTTTLQPPHGIRWTRSFGGSLAEYASDVVALPDSGFIVVGSTNSTDLDIGGSRNSTDGFLARYDKDGHVIWKHVFGGPLFDDIRTVVMASPGILYAAGTMEDASGGNVWIIKFNLNGDTLWTRTYGGSQADEGWSVLGADDGGCYFAGQTESSDGDVHDFETPPTGAYFPVNMWLAKLDASGTLQWDSCYFGQSHAYEAVNLKRTKDNRILVAGSAIGLKDFNLTTSGLLLMLNNDGSRVMEKIYPIDGLFRRINSVVVNDDNSFTFAGQSGPEGSLDIDTTYSGIHGENDIWTGMVDNAGNLVWEKYFGGSGSEVGNSITTTSDGNYLIAGAAESNDGNVTGNHGGQSDGWLVKMAPGGALLWQKTIGGTNTEVFHSLTGLADHSVMAVGLTASNDGDIVGYRGGNTDMLLAKLGMSNFITGNVYIDLNSNGIKEPNEPYFRKGVIDAVSNVRQHSGIVTDGFYQVSVDTGDYVVKFYTVDSGYYNVIPASVNIGFNNYSQTAVADFRLVKKAEINDLQLSVLPLSIARPGFSILYRIKYENKGTIESVPVTIRIKADERTTFLSSTVPYSSVVGDTLVWVLPAPGILETGSFDISLRVKPPPAVNNGDSLQLYGEILPIAIDSTPLNNIAMVNQLVRGSYDPNDKIEVHGNSLPYDFIQNDEYLTYVIRFQNTGTDTAFNVYVRDTLNSRFDWNTFEMIDASHSYVLSIEGGNILEWYFRDIYLPDSNVNEPGSHGFIAFRIKPEPDVQQGDTLENDASIYFDFNLPVLTNLMQSTIGSIAAVLPSTVLQITASWKDDTKAKIKWLAVNESKVERYVVEHSTDGIHFIPVGYVKATNEIGGHYYEFFHERADQRINYYRLKTVDVDGKTALSKVVVLQKARDIVSSMKIYPVPTKELITISIPGLSKGLGTLSIYGVDGKPVSMKVLGIINQDNFRLTFDCNTLNKGVYILHCTIGDKWYRGKLVIQ